MDPQFLFHYDSNLEKYSVQCCHWFSVDEIQLW